MNINATMSLFFLFLQKLKALFLSEVYLPLSQTFSLKSKQFCKYSKNPINSDISYLPTDD